jgi:hypothetical protein
MPGNRRNGYQAVTPYKPQAPADIELLFEEEGYGRNDDIVPSRVGVPVATGLTGIELVRETEKFFDEEPLSPDRDADLIDDLTAS